MRRSISSLLVLFVLALPSAASAHTDPESGAAVEPAPSSMVSYETTLDDRPFADPHVRIFLRDNAPYKWSYNGAQTSITASAQFDLALDPMGACFTNPTGTVDIRIREWNVDPALISPWKTTNWFDKSAMCANAAFGEVWHWDDSLGFVGQNARNFELQLMDLATGSVYFTAFVTAEFVSPTPPSALAISSTSSIAVNLQWQDNSLWENHMELQRAGGTSDSWTTIDRVTNVNRGTVTYQDYVPSSPLLNTYRYRVRAVSGDKTSAWTPAVASSSPFMPTGFTAIAAAGEVALAWVDVLGEDGYEIERSQDGFATVQSVWTVPENAMTFIDSSVGPLTAYRYRIRAVNAKGASGWATLEALTPGLDL